ncbi:Aste57867_21076 [Aphanomyces stellatus]|uniref:Aste57867_21076 protein n=1 Tax=Aphanomyces stellatus TaxID=120398 RepID=A0A485LLA0_9STRA|nr:hypothetical protein As57867_021008 [Aphanomyces stellatus]VFT97750.1 Aste57867_21076 [Aphanomyces stellatus]
MAWLEAVTNSASPALAAQAWDRAPVRIQTGESRVECSVCGLLAPKRQTAPATKTTNEPLQTVKTDHEHPFGDVDKLAGDVSAASVGLVQFDVRLASMKKIDALLSPWYADHGAAARWIQQKQHEQRLVVLASHCAFRSDICSKAALVAWAASNGHLDVIQLLHAIKPSLSTKASRAMVIAAACGQLRVLQWQHDHHAQRLSASVLLAAATHNRLQVLQWITGHDTKMVWWQAAIAAVMNEDTHAWLDSTTQQMQQSNVRVICPTCKCTILPSSVVPPTLQTTTLVAS